jgi:hypothetical protein
MQTNTGTCSRRAPGLLAAFLTAFLAMAVARSEAQTETPQQLKATCIKAGTKRPAELTGHFWMYKDEYTAGPHAGLGYRLQTMPQACFGQYRRILFVNFRYKTAQKGWRTYHGLAEGGAPAWFPLYDGDFGSGVYKFGETPVALGAEWGSAENAKHTSEWGKLEQAKGRVRLWVKSIETGHVVAHKVYNIKTHICSHYVYYGRNNACAYR